MKCTEQTYCSSENKEKHSANYVLAKQAYAHMTANSIISLEKTTELKNDIKHKNNNNPNMQIKIIK
jgi:hypothetical protein